jgi:hypothetical protein
VQSLELAGERRSEATARSAPERLIAAVHRYADFVSNHQPGFVDMGRVIRTLFDHGGTTVTAYPDSSAAFVCHREAVVLRVVDSFIETGIARLLAPEEHSLLL